MRAVVEEKQVAVGQRRWRMLARQGWSAKLPDNFAGFPIDDDDSGDVTKAQDDIAIRQLSYAIAMGPLFALILYRRNAIRLGIEVLPSTPLPDHLSVSCHLDEIVRIHLPVVLRTGHTTFDLRNEILRQLS